MHTMVTLMYVWKIIMGYPRYFSSELWWKGKFQENSKSLESSSNFQNWHMPEFGKVHDECFVLQEEPFLNSTAWLTCSSMAKLAADLNHDLRARTHLGSLRHAGDSSRIKGLMMPNLLPGGHKYSSNKRWISVEITSKLQFGKLLTGKLWICVTDLRAKSIHHNAS